MEYPLDLGSEGDPFIEVFTFNLGFSSYLPLIWGSFHGLSLVDFDLGFFSWASFVDVDSELTFLEYPSLS